MQERFKPPLPARRGDRLAGKGQPEDIAWMAVYLASDESSWVTAADFNIDAGATGW